jgi:phosphoribosylaminoimidazole-succinocarboxamide synthase
MNLRHLHSGKVRDLYELPGGDLLMVARDTISAYDYVLDTPIPDKGRILTQLSLWWFERLADLIPNHVVSTEPPTGAPADWAGRVMVVRRLDMVAVECVARGYLAGSGLSEYRRSGTVCGIALPPGLEDGSRLPEPVFTPTTKAPVGEHDEPMTYAEVEAAVGADLAARLRDITVAVYRRGAELARERGIIVADTKIELGRAPDGGLILADEVLTPDSSRFWPADQWSPGRSQPSFDKQFVRDWLVSPESGWDRSSGQAPPPLPDKIVDRTRAKYVEAYERLTGRAFT